MKIARIVAAGVASVGLIVVGVMASDAAVRPDCKNLMYPLCPRSVAATQVVDNSLPGSTKLAPGSVSEDRLTPQVKAKLNGVQDGTVHLDSLDDNVRRMVTTDANTPDVRGSLLVQYATAPKVIEKVGGSFKTNKTLLGAFKIPAGQNLKLDAYMFASREVAGAPGTHAQLALRIGSTETEFGVDMGTIFQPLPSGKGREVTGSTFWVGAVSQETVVEVYGFGYNDDSSAAGSGEYTISSRIAVTQG